MIYGTGIDIIGVERIKEAITKREDRFLSKIFTDNEIKESSKHNNPTHYFSGRWAAKEAFSKALGTGIGEICSWHDIEILNTSTGAPKCHISDKLSSMLFDKKKIKKIMISISHEKEHACAMVIIEI